MIFLKTKEDCLIEYFGEHYEQFGNILRILFGALDTDIFDDGKNILNQFLRLLLSDLQILVEKFEEQVNSSQSTVNLSLILLFKI